MLRTALLALCLGLFVSCFAGAADVDATRRLHALFDEAWERELRIDPIAASYVGDERYAARWPDMSAAALARRRQEDAALLTRLEEIPSGELPAAEQLNRELFRRLYEHRIALYDFNVHLRPFDQLNYSNSIQTLSEIAGLLTFATERHYRDWLARLRGFGTLMDQQIALARIGLQRRNVQPRIIVERTLAQVSTQRVDKPEDSPFFAPFRQWPAAIPSERQRELRDAARKAIAEVIRPAFERLERFLRDEYLPASRPSVGIWDTPRGAEHYQHCVRWFTTTSLTPEQIHDIGLQEVARIRDEMDKVIAQIGFKGSFAQFLDFLRTDVRSRYEDPKALLHAYMVMAKKIDPLLTEYFGRLPRTPYGVRPIPMSTAPATTTAYYQAGSRDGRRPAYFYVNLYRPDQRPTYEIPVLTAHEAVPGHHLQQALAQEAGELPKFRQDFDATAFVEGWALYAESLGDEMGLYVDPYDKFGQLSYEMWRAVRLVVDTGMHHKRWSREQAIAFFKENTAKSELDIVNEIDRYIAWPGQATAYKIGELKIKELRGRASRELGERFDIREFHDEVLRRGAIPLDILEQHIDAWIARKKSSWANP